ncbi:hypothetical protein LAWI1_G003201 [Lachnellula willkommii]|uniref:Uncharacterized protein n=1 Tax=Lachnellula willkommii TaxID=215461 RepID=A0A559M8C2_9HELO|nr:hypothetical protein LAWI1_G003201 [Lachnellula willkommii]
MERSGNAQNTVAGVRGATNGQAALKLEGASGEDVWDEERLEKAMARLKEMHIQVCILSKHMPSYAIQVLTEIVQPAKKSANHPSQTPRTANQEATFTLFSEFAKSSTTANQEVQQFQRLMKEEETSVVLEQARKSRAENPNDIKPWRAREHPDWLTRDT